MSTEVIDINCGVHWLTFTAGSELERVMAAFPTHNFSSMQDKGGRGHPGHILHESGARIYCGSWRDDQPIVVDADGTTCESWAKELLHTAKDLGGIVTRADTAVDIEPEEEATARLTAMLQAFRAGRCDTQMKQSKWEDTKGGKRPGNTAYFGSKKYSEVFLRAYDERGPLRLEWVFRPAADAGKHLAAILLNGAAPVWRSLAKTCVFPFDWYKRLLRGPDVEWDEPEEEATELRTLIESLRVQYGPTLLFLREIGALDDVVCEAKSPRKSAVVKKIAWCDQAAELGYDGEKAKTIKARLQCELKSRRGAG